MTNPAVAFESFEREGISAEHLGDLIAMADASGEGERYLEEAERQIGVVAVHGNVQEKSAFLEAVRRQLDQVKGEQEKKLIDANLDALAEKVGVEIIQPLRQAEEARGAGVTAPHIPEAARPSAAVPQAEKVPVVAEGVDGGGREKNALRRANEAVDSVLPQHWSDETKTTVKAVGVGVAVAAIGYGVYRFAKWLFGGVKKMKDATVEGAKKTGGWLFKAGLLATAGVVGFLGFKALKNSLLGKIDAMTGAVKDQVAAARQTVINLEQKAEGLLRQKNDLERNLVLAAETEKEQYRQQLQEVTNNLDAARQELRTASAAVAEAMKPKPQEADSKAKPQGEPEKTVEGKGVDGANREAAVELAEAGTLPLIARGLVAFESVPDWDALEQTRVQHVIDVLSSSREMTMSGILSSVSGEAVVTRLFQTEEDPESHEKAQLLLVRYCAKSKERLLVAGKTDADINGMTLDVFLKEVAGTYGVAGSILQQLRDNKGDITQALRDTDMGELVKEGGGMKQEVTEYLHERKLENVSALELAQALPGFSQTVGEFLGNQTDPKTLEPLPHAVWELCQEMQEMKTHTYMLPFFHKLFPEHDWSKSQTQNIETARQILVNHMPLSQAVRLHFYARMMRKQNPAGVVLMQAEIFKYVVDRDKGIWDIPWAKNKDVRLMDRMAKVAASGTWEEWDELDLDVDYTIVREAMQNMGIVGKHVAWNTAMALLGMGGKGAITTGTLAVDNPLVLGTPIALGSSALILRKYLALRRSASPEEALKRLRLMRSDRMAFNQIMRGVRGIQISMDSVESGDAFLGQIIEKIKNIRVESELAGNRRITNITSELSSELNNCTTATLNNGEKAWKNFLKIAEKHKGVSSEIDQVIERIHLVCNDGGIRNAISVAARPRVGHFKYAVRLTNNAVGLPARAVAWTADKVLPATGRVLGRTVGAGARVLRHPMAGRIGVGGAGAALEFGYAALDYFEGEGAIAEMKNRQSDIILELTKYSAEPEDGSEPILKREDKKNGEVVFTLAGAKGATITVKDIKDLYNEKDEDVARWNRVGIGAASGTFLLGAMVAGSGGTALLAIPVVIAAHEGVSQLKESIAQHRRRQFIDRAPVWLLAMLGSAGILGRDEYGMMDENTGFTRSDVLPRDWEEAGSLLLPGGGTKYLVERIGQSGETEKQKREVREKMLQALAYGEMSAYHPELRAELPGGGDERILFDPQGEFLKPGGDYESIVLPFAKLQMLADGRFASTEDAEKLVVSSTEHGETFIGHPMRRAMLFYVQHVRELQYREVMRAIAEEPDVETRQSLQKEFDEEIDLFKDQWYIFNTHPKNLPTLGGEETYAQVLLRERWEAVKNAGADAGRVAAQGYAVPGDPIAENSLAHFLNTAVDPHFREAQKARLESYASRPGQVLPISFGDMETWGTDEEFNAMFTAQTEELRRLNEAVEKGVMLSDASVRALTDQYSTEQIDKYLSFQQQRDFYKEYIEWRGNGVSLPVDYSAWISLFKEWKTGGEPVLLDEQIFQQMQHSFQAVTDGTASFNVESILQPNTINTGSGLNVSSLSLAGYDAQKPGQMLFTLDGYYAQRAAREHLQGQQAEEHIERLSGGARRESPLGPFQEYVSAATEAEGKTTDHPAKMPVAAEVVDRTGQRKPLLSFAGLDLGKCLAIPEEQINTVMSQFRKGDGLDALRMEMLVRRVFVIVRMPSSAERKAA